MAMMSIWSMLLPAGLSVQAIIDRIEAKNIEAVVCDTSTPSILNDVQRYRVAGCGEAFAARFAGGTARLGTAERDACNVAFARSCGDTRVRIHGA